MQAIKENWGEVRFSTYEESGYDIVSFDFFDGKWIEKYIEVKTTKSNDPNDSFFISPNEIATSEEKGEQYFLYRLYDLKIDGKVQCIVIQGPITNHIEIKPTMFKANIVI